CARAANCRFDGPMSDVSGIRTFEESDLSQVARLWDRLLRPASSLQPAEAEDFLRRTLLTSPWFDPELPSLVYADAQGRVVGFLASSVRRLLYAERPITAVTAAHFMVDPDAGVRGAGALLLGRLFKGPQDLTMTDCATAETQAIWEALGGSAS